MNTLINPPCLSELDLKGLFDDEDRRTDIFLTEEEVIERAKENPEALPDLLIPFHEMENEGVRKIAGVLAVLKEEGRPQINTTICSTIMLFPPKVRKGFLKNHPDILIDSFTELEDGQRKNLVLEVIRAKERGWKSLFIKIIQLIKSEEQGDKGRERAACYLHLLLLAFEPEAKNEWLLYCTETLNENSSWPFLMIMLKAEDREFVLAYLKESRVCDLSENGYFNYLLLLSKEKDSHPSEVRSTIRQIFKHFHHQRKFIEILDCFSTLSEKMQVSLLDSMSTIDLRFVLNENQESLPLLLTWLDKLLYYKEEFKAKKQMFNEFLPFLSKYEGSSILENLNDLQSPWGCYFLAFGSDELSKDITNFACLDDRSTFFHHDKFDVTTRKVLNALYHSKKVSDYASVYFDLTNPVIDLEMRDHNLITTLNYLEAIEIESLEICKPLIEKIPPLIIGLSSLDRKMREQVVKLVPLMTDEQLKFFVCTLPKEQLEEVIQQYEAKLEGASLLAILQALSPKQVCLFLANRVEQLKRYNKDFRSRYRALISEFDEVKKNRSITPEKLDALQREVYLLQVVAEKPKQLMFSVLNKFFNKTDSRYCQRQLISCSIRKQLNAIMNEFKKESENLLAKIPMFRLGGVISTEIDQITGYADHVEVDLTEKLYLGFWLMAREYTLPYLGISPHSSLGITNLGELTILGIQNNEDLELLGISAEWEEQVRKGVEKFEALSLAFANDLSSSFCEPVSNKRKLPEMWSLWENLSRIEVESKETAQAISQQLVELLTIPDQIPPHAVEECIAFFNSLSNFRFCTKAELNFIKKTAKSLRENQMDGPLLKKSFCRGLLLLREQQPLFCLKHYLLRNENLKTTWEQLRSHGYNSIEDLYKAKLIKNSRQLLKLHTQM